MEIYNPETYSIRWVCTECNGWFITKGSFLSHQRTHVSVSCKCCMTEMSLAQYHHHNHSTCEPLKEFSYEPKPTWYI